MRITPFHSILVLGILFGASIGILCYLKLVQTDDPQLAIEAFEQLQGWLTRGVPLIAFALLFLQTRSYKLQQSTGWRFLLCWLYFAVFTAIDYIWLNEFVFQYSKQMGTWEGGFNAMGIVGGVLISAFGLACGAGYVFAGAKRGSLPE